MPNTGDLLQDTIRWRANGFEVCTIMPPEDASAQDIVEQTFNECSGLVVSLAEAQARVDDRILVDAPTCLPVCDGVLQLNEVFSGIVLNNNQDESLHANRNGVKVCVKFKKTPI